MDKQALHKQIISELETVYQGAVDAAQRAYDTAVDEENEAENKYDTMGLEASYLAHGQSQRMAECLDDIVTFRALQVTQFSSLTPINIGALIYLKDDHDDEHIIFLSPVAGGLKVLFNKNEMTLITPSSPIGQALSASFVGDEISVKIKSDIKQYEIIKVY